MPDTLGKEPAPDEVAFQIVALKEALARANDHTVRRGEDLDSGHVAAEPPSPQPVPRRRGFAVIRACGFEEVQIVAAVRPASDEVPLARRSERQRRHPAGPTLDPVVGQETTVRVQDSACRDIGEDVTADDDPRLAGPVDLGDADAPRHSLVVAPAPSLLAVPAEAPYLDVAAAHGEQRALVVPGAGHLDRRGGHELPPRPRAGFALDLALPQDSALRIERRQHVRSVANE